MVQGASGSFGRLLVGMGLALVVLGLLFLLGERFPWLRLGRLPGDLRIERERFRFYFPLATSLLLSVLLTLALWLLRRR